MIKKQRQQGVTFLGFLFACALIIFFAFLAMRLWPIYNEKIKVDQAINSVVQREDIGSLNRNAIGKYMLRHFEIEDVDHFSSMKDLAEILSVKKIKGKKSRLLQMKYEIRRPIIEGLDLLYTYDKSVVIKGTDG